MDAVGSIAAAVPGAHYVLTVVCGVIAVLDPPYQQISWAAWDSICQTWPNYTALLLLSAAALTSVIWASLHSRPGSQLLAKPYHSRSSSLYQCDFALPATCSQSYCSL